MSNNISIAIFDFPSDKTIEDTCALWAKFLPEALAHRELSKSHV